MLRDGAKVAYVGWPTDDGLVVGDEGRVLQVGTTGSHVRWVSGARTDAIDLIRNDDLVVGASLASDPVAGLDDSLDDPTMVHVAVRDTFERTGAVGVLDALNEAGHLAHFEVIAEEALAFVASRVRQDPAVAAVLSQLDPGEGDEVVNLATAALLRDAFGED